MLDNDKRKKETKSDYPKKILDHPKNPKMWSKWHFFDFFSKIALTILMKLAQNVELINSEHLAKTACHILFPFLRLSSTKRRFWPKVVSKERAISREPLTLSKIWFEFSFWYVSSDLCRLVVFRVYRENGQFSCIFWINLAQYLDNHLKDFDENWSEVRQNEYQKDGLRYLRQPKSFKIDLNLWMTEYSHIQISGVHINSCLFNLPCNLFDWMRINWLREGIEGTGMKRYQSQSLTQRNVYQVPLRPLLFPCLEFVILIWIIYLFECLIIDICFQKMLDFIYIFSTI